MKDDFSTVVEEDTIWAIWEHVAEAVLWGEIYEFGNQLSSRLIFGLLNE